MDILNLDASPAASERARQKARWSPNITGSRTLTDIEMNAPTICLRTQPIERAHGLTPEIFEQLYLTGPGKPIIVTDAMNSWAALSRWSFDFFKTRYGSDKVRPGTWVGKSRLKYMALGHYLDYLDTPNAKYPGLWLDPETMSPCVAPDEASSAPLYLPWNGFVKHPELLEDIQLSPKFVEDWTPFLPPAFLKTLDEATRYFSSGLLIGPRNAQIGLHHDFLHTHAYLAQIIGKKRCVLFSPEDSAGLYNGKVDVDEPDFEKFPHFRNVTAHEGILAPGELLFIPHLWWHHVVSLEKTITVNYNFFNRVNFSGYLTDLVQNLPTVVNGLEKCPGARDALGFQWTSRGFDFPESGKS